MCSRVIGYQVASPDAFNTEVSYTSIDHFYVDGISITHGSPRKHIWTYAGGISDHDTDSPSITSSCHVKLQEQFNHHHFLVITIIVRREIQIMTGMMVKYLLLTNYGMVNSVKVLVVPLTLLHGSVWNYPTL